MSRTNHHRRYDRWNIEERYFNYLRFRNPEVWGVEMHKVGMEVRDLRFYAGCRRTPQAVHRVLYFHTGYPYKFHHGKNGVAKSYADIRESQFRTATRRYVDEARDVWNAGGDVDEVREPDRRPRSIDCDLW